MISSGLPPPYTQLAGLLAGSALHAARIAAQIFGNELREPLERVVACVCVDVAYRRALWPTNSMAADCESTRSFRHGNVSVAQAMKS